MDSTTASGLAAVVTSALLQVVKDHLRISPGALKWVAAIVGALAGGSTGFIAGAEGTGALATNLGFSALLTTGTHSFLLQDGPIGDALRSIGDALFRTPPAPPAPGV